MQQNETRTISLISFRINLTHVKQHFCATRLNSIVNKLVTCKLINPSIRVEDTFVNNVRIASDVPLVTCGTLHPYLDAIVTDVAHNHPEPDVLFPCGVRKHSGSRDDVASDGRQESGRSASEKAAMRRDTASNTFGTSSSPDPLC